MNDINKKKMYQVISLTLLFIMFLFMFWDSSKQSFWLDELDWTIYYLARSNILEMIKLLLQTGFNLPLYYILMYPIYQIVPYGEQWLLLPNIIAILFGIMMMRKVGEKIGGEDVGFACLCMGVTSYILIDQGAFELRPYAFLFCFSVWTLYRYLCRLENSTKRNEILYTISILLLAYIHWFGCLIIAFYFLVDVYRWVKKKISLSSFIPYVILGILFLPWFVLMMMKHTSSFSEYWAEAPKLDSFFRTIKYLLSFQSVSIHLFLIGCISLLIYIIFKKKEKYQSYLLCLGSIFWVVGTIIIYSKFINPEGSLFVNRYFIVVLPHVLIIEALPLSELLNLKVTINNSPLIVNINGITINKSISLVIVLSLITIIGYQNYVKAHEENTIYYEPYREMSNVIASNREAYEDDSAVITSRGYAYITYYFEKRNRNLPTNVYEGHSDSTLGQIVSEGKWIKQRPITKDDLLEYNTLFLFNGHTHFDNSLMDFVRKNYKLIKEYKDLGLYIYQK